MMDMRLALLQLLLADLRKRIEDDPKQAIEFIDAYLARAEELQESNSTRMSDVD